MKTTITTITLLGHVIEIDGIDINELTSIAYDNVIDTMNQSIMNGEDEGTFSLDGKDYDWKKEEGINVEDYEMITYENKMMAEALTTLGFTQEQISSICSGGFKPAVVNEDTIKGYVAGMFLSDVEHGEKDYEDFMSDKSELSYWFPFEDFNTQWMKEEMQKMVTSLKRLAIPRLIGAPAKKSKITMQQLELEGVNAIISLYQTDSEVTGGQFADGLVDDMEADFEAPLDITLIMNNIQLFREWDYEGEEEEVLVPAQANENAYLSSKVAILKNTGSVVFEHEQMIYNIWESDEGYTYNMYDFDDFTCGEHLVSEDGGCCTGTAHEAVFMAIGEQL